MLPFLGQRLHSRRVKQRAVANIHDDPFRQWGFAQIKYSQTNVWASVLVPAESLVFLGTALSVIQRPTLCLP